ncbi:hypothetical protein RclHR1_14560001 [Rhizophagus clarus]|uniref:Uncharacterized protein n=1 Tax=Rhizophagus clarus TaxID=94130 RepID=A0A2Z6QTL8_9GLOM|nr:hypothetical protein RclHR1_14560001 [Rhizophagus clarus]GES82452.1 hypothetical protein GLOIN_2v1720069 [Rhizophagus clarus]GES98519.1 hypothetical protein GLOIN_2v1720069 [Rhizophagus clarus]
MDPITRLLSASQVHEKVFSQMPPIATHYAVKKGVETRMMNYSSLLANAINCDTLCGKKSSNAKQEAQHEVSFSKIGPEDILEITRLVKSMHMTLGGIDKKNGRTVRSL